MLVFHYFALRKSRCTNFQFIIQFIQNGDTVVTIAAHTENVDLLNMLLAFPGVNVNQQDKVRNAYLFVIT